MKNLLTVLLALVFLCSIQFSLTAQIKEDYPVDPDSKPNPDIPHGEVLKFSFEESKIFPGTVRDYWVYVPAQYTPDKPACLYVNQDGIQWQAPTVFDNLIAKKEMPVTIGVFVMHGRVKGSATSLDRFNRSFEYDGLGDNYVRFLLEELLPQVETKRTADGRAIHFSHEANDHAIGGSSSGAIAAFTAAWERPDAFSRVFSSIGTYVGLRGGDRYPTLIRKSEPKPIRVFLQDGANDLNIYAGDWWMANQTMERALIFSGYEVNHIWGEGAHNGKHGTAIFPNVMRWLWKDWPQPVKAGISKNATLNDVLVPGENWQNVGGDYKSARSLAANSQGEIYFYDQSGKNIWRLGTDGKLLTFAKSSGDLGALVFGPDQRLYASSQSERRINSLDGNGKSKTLVGNLPINASVLAHNGDLYAAETGGAASNSAKIWLIKSNGQKFLADSGLNTIGGLALSPDQSLLYANEPTSHWIYSYQIKPDGSLQYKQRYYWLHVPDQADGSGAGSMAVDRDGRLYVATTLGVQICDQAGRVNAIIPTPVGAASSLAFGGPAFDTIYVTSGDKIYKRKLKIKGAPAWDASTKPAAPRL